MKSFLLIFTACLGLTACASRAPVPESDTVQIQDPNTDERRTQYYLEQLHKKKMRFLQKSQIPGAIDNPNDETRSAFADDTINCRAIEESQWGRSIKYRKNDPAYKLYLDTLTRCYKQEE